MTKRYVYAFIVVNLESNINRMNIQNIACMGLSRQHAICTKDSAHHDFTYMHMEEFGVENVLTSTSIFLTQIHPTRPNWAV
jgi:hypothetical protein